MEDRGYWLGFSAFSGVGPMKFQKLLRYFKTARDTWKASESQLQSSGLGEKLTQKFIAFRNKFSIELYAEQLEKKGVNYLTFSDKEYPGLLAQIKNPPFVLYVKGQMPAEVANENFFVPHSHAARHANRKNFVSSPQATWDINKSIAVVGTRRITNYGREVTEMFVRELVNAGFTIVSGLAIGVDAVAHESAIENNGKTIAVLGCGVDCCTPRENQALYNSIVEGNGVIVSELPLGHPPTKGSFPSRNRIIAGLSLGVLVTEGAEDSGALITADYALKFNRKVFAVPGPITSSLSKGPYKLIQKGAKLVTKTEDIINELGIKNYELGIKKREIKGASKEEQRILDILENEALHFDEVARRTGFESAKLGSILSILEMKGMVKSLENGLFGVAN